jgi:hypothetical protein
VGLRDLFIAAVKENNVKREVLRFLEKEKHFFTLTSLWSVTISDESVNGQIN